MKYIRSSGLTLFETAPSDLFRYSIKIVAFRAVGLIKWKSFRGEWEHPVSMLLPEIPIGRLVMFGFQPETGLHLCYWERKREIK